MDAFNIYLKPLIEDLSVNDDILLTLRYKDEQLFKAMGRRLLSGIARERFSNFSFPAPHQNFQGNSTIRFYVPLHPPLIASDSLGGDA